MTFTPPTLAEVLDEWLEAEATWDNVRPTNPSLQVLPENLAAVRMRLAGHEVARTLSRAAQLGGAASYSESAIAAELAKHFPMTAPMTLQRVASSLVALLTTKGE